MRVRLLVVIATVFAFGTPAHAQDDEALAKRFTKGKRVKKRGSVSKLRGHRVSFAGRKTLTVGQIADEVFKEQRELAKEFKGARNALLRAPVTTDEVIETDEAVVITTSTKITVVDPDAMRRKSKRFGKFRSKKRRGAVTLGSLDRSRRQAFTGLRAKMRKLPANHPLRKAADKSEAALLEAIEAGQGDVTVTSTIVVPKTPMKRNATGQLMIRTVDKNGNVDFKRTVGVRSVADRFGGGVISKASSDGEIPRPSASKAFGKTTSRAKFLTGFTEADDFIWEKRWDFSFGYFSVKFHPWYEFGLRVPVEIKGTLEPKTIIYKGPKDEPHEFSVELSAKAFNAGKSYYEATGLDRSLIKDGNEFLLGAGFEIIVRVKAGKLVDKKWVIPKNASFSMSQNFDPPFGNCGTKCGFEVWIDPSISRTKISLLGIVTGAAHIGFNVSGKGTASADFEAIYGNDTIPSWRAGKKNQKRKKHRVSFTSAANSFKYKAEARRNSLKNVTKHYGYKLSAPRYDWTMVITPGVKATVRVKARPLFNDQFTIGPKWFDSFAIKLGTVKLDAHKGTKRSYKVNHGDKTWKKTGAR